MNFTIDISGKPLLESLLTIDFSGFIIDIHNDFNCVGIKVLNRKFLFRFSNSEKHKLEIMLSDFEIVKQEIDFDFSGPVTLDNFYKGRIEYKNKLIDFDEKGRSCFYFHFYENLYLEIVAKTVEVSFMQQSF